MQNSRRTFLKQSSVLLAGAGLFSKQMTGFINPRELTGVQLYSVRADMMKDPLGTLKQLASFGYKFVEHANYINRKFYGYSAADFRKVLNDLGLKMPSGHTVMGKAHWDADKKQFTDAWKWTVEDAAIVGQQFVISPWLDESLRKTKDDLIRYMDVFNKSGELCKKSGMKFGYHNHDFEFSQQLDGESVYDLMLANTDPNLVIQQLDIGNLYNGGAKAIDIVQKFPGRFQSMHVKDEISSSTGNEKFESTVLGKGIVNVKDVIDLGRKSGGTIHFIIEQESYQGQAPLDAMKEDLEIMKKWGY
ncbi:MAG: sugar phosphate isomerase/epimerase family protein [Chitinophagaceae bacterium]